MLTVILQVEHGRSEEAINFYQLIFHAEVLLRVPHFIEMNRTCILGQRVFLRIDKTILEVVDVHPHLIESHITYTFPTRYTENVHVVAALLQGNQQIVQVQDQTAGHARMYSFTDPFGFRWRVASEALNPLIPVAQPVLPAP